MRCLVDEWEREIGVAYSRFGQKCCEMEKEKSGRSKIARSPPLATQARGPCVQTRLWAISTPLAPSGGDIGDLGFRRRGQLKKPK